MLAWITYCLPLRPMKRQHSSSTVALRIWNRSWFLGKTCSSVLISSFSVFRHAIVPDRPEPPEEARCSGSSHYTLWHARAVGRVQQAVLKLGGWWTSRHEMRDAVSFWWDRQELFPDRELSRLATSGHCFASLTHTHIQQGTQFNFQNTPSLSLTRWCEWNPQGREVVLVWQVVFHSPAH